MINTLQDVSDEAGKILPGAGRAAQEHQDLVIGMPAIASTTSGEDCLPSASSNTGRAAPIPIRPSAHAAASLTSS
jgi:hypothetical protein